MQTNRWLRFIRPHAAALTISLVLVSVLLAGVRDPLALFVWGAIALLFHTCGFAMNNVCDYDNDRKDPKKKHFPTVSGEIDINAAIEIVLIMFTLWLFVGVSAGIVSHYRAATLLCFIGATAAALFYNIYGKRTVFGNLGECLAFSLLMPFAYFATAHTLDYPIVLVFLYSTLTIFVQNWCEGDLKDVDVDPVTLLGQLGVRKLNAFSGQLYILTVPRSVYVLSGACLIIAGACLALLPIPLLYVGLSLALFAYGMLFHFNQFEVSDTPTMLRLAVVKTFLLGLAFYVALMPLLGILEMAAMFAFVVLWAVAFNRLTWRTTLEPKV